MTLELLKASLALFGALVGAYIGARLALKRFRRERTYDKRLEWHLAALAAVHDLEAEISQWNYATTPRSEDYEKAVGRFRRVAVESKAFMGEVSYGALGLAFMGSQGAAERTRYASIVDASPEALRALARIEIKKVREAESIIIEALRQLMPDDPAPPLTRMRWAVRRTLRRTLRPDIKPRAQSEADMIGAEKLLSLSDEELAARLTARRRILEELWPGSFLVLSIGLPSGYTANLSGSGLQTQDFEGGTLPEVFAKLGAAVASSAPDDWALKSAFLNRAAGMREKALEPAKPASGH